MAEIPVIDFAALDRPELVSAIDRACRTTGFFVIANPPVAPDLVESVYSQARAFYDLPAETKERYAIADQPTHRGYVPPGEEQYGAVQGAAGDDDALPREVKEGFEVGLETPADDPDVAAGALFLGPNPWPAERPEFRAAVSAYYDAMAGLGETLLRLFAEGLAIEAERFAAMRRRPCSTLRLLKYHAREVDPGETALGIGVHTDSECFTLLSTRGAGLEAVSRAGRWEAVPEVPGGLVVNIGDTMEVWTNGAYVSTQHRVVSDGRERYSLPFFVGADFFEVIAPLPELTGPEGPKYEPYVYGRHIVSEYAKGFRYLRRLAAEGRLELESAPDAVSRFAKAAV